MLLAHISIPQKTERLERVVVKRMERTRTRKAYSAGLADIFNTNEAYRVMN